MIVVASGGIRLEAAERELRVDAPRPASEWPSKWLKSPRWWRLMRELEYLGTPESISYDDFTPLLREGFRFPVLFGGWSPLTVEVDEATAPRFLMGEAFVDVERAGRYIRRPGSDSAWLLDDPTWRLLECPPALQRDLAVEANARLRGELARTEVIYGDWPSRRFATHKGWVEQRHVENWSGPVTPLSGRVGVRNGLPVRLPGSGRVLVRDDYPGGDEEALRTSSLQSMSGSELETVVACTFLWHGFRVVLPADACWLSGAVLAVREGTVTVVWLTDSCDKGTLAEVHQAECRLRRLCPATYSSGVVAREPVSAASKQAGNWLGMRVRDRLELGNLVAGDAIPLAALGWAASARCASPGETLELLQQARMVP